MMIQVTFNADIMSKNFLPALGCKPTAIHLMFSRPAIHCLLCISPISHFTQLAAGTLVPIRAVT